MEFIFCYNIQRVTNKVNLIKEFLCQLGRVQNAMKIKKGNSYCGSPSAFT